MKGRTSNRGCPLTSLGAFTHTQAHTQIHTEGYYIQSTLLNLNCIQIKNNKANIQSLSRLQRRLIYQYILESWSIQKTYRLAHSENSFYAQQRCSIFKCIKTTVFSWNFSIFSIVSTCNLVIMIASKNSPLGLIRESYSTCLVLEKKLKKVFYIQYDLWIRTTIIYHKEVQQIAKIILTK